MEVVKWIPGWISVVSACMHVRLSVCTPKRKSALAIDSQIGIYRPRPAYLVGCMH